MAAAHLGISRRSVIRYEQGYTLHPHVSSALALCDLESVYAAELNAYLGRT
jgi:DNA-binding XRE family transcriptional regulator